MASSFTRFAREGHHFELLIFVDSIGLLPTSPSNVISNYGMPKAVYYIGQLLKLNSTVDSETISNFELDAGIIFIFANSAKTSANSRNFFNCYLGVISPERPSIGRLSSSNPSSITDDQPIAMLSQDDTGLFYIHEIFGFKCEYDGTSQLTLSWENSMYTDFDALYGLQFFGY